MNNINQLGLKLLFLSTALLSLGFLIGYKSNKLANKSSNEAAVGTKREKVECTDELLNMDDLEKDTRGNVTAMKLVKDRCLWVLQSKFFDATGDNEEEMFLITSSAGCGSCHGQQLYVFSGDDLLLEVAEGDIIIGQIDDSRKYEGIKNYPKGFAGFIMKVPIRLAQESLAGATKGIKTVFRYDKELGLIKHYEEVAPYEWGSDKL